MATNTTNYNLIKPDYEDDADIKDLNDNFDSIDALIADNANNIATYNTYLVAGATAITANTDLNTLLAPGIYTCNSSAIATTLTNSPYTASGFRLDVIQTSSANFKKQILQSNQMGTDSSRYERSYSTSSNTFSSWYKFEGTAVT